MRAAVLLAPYSLAVRDVPDPHPEPGEVLVEVDLAGVCGSDLALFSGRRAAPAYPLILGHEAVGRRLDTGARVVVEPNIPCATCTVCQRGQGNVCPNKTSLGLNAPGVFAERVAVPRDYVHDLPPHIAELDAVTVEPLAVAVHALAIGNLKPDDPVAVVGCGLQGLLLVQLAKTRGASVLAVDIRSEALATAQSLGADRTLHVTSDSHIAADPRPRVVFETAGSANAVETALRLVSNGGSVVLVGLAADPISLTPLRFVRRGLNLLSSLIYDHPRDFRCAIDLVSSGALHPGQHIRSVVDLAQAPAALANHAPEKLVFAMQDAECVVP